MEGYAKIELLREWLLPITRLVTAKMLERITCRSEGVELDWIRCLSRREQARYRTDKDMRGPDGLGAEIAC